MQIDTWHREKMSLPQKPGDRPAPFVPGPQPRNALAPTSGPDAIYSGDTMAMAERFHSTASLVLFPLKQDCPLSTVHCPLSTVHDVHCHVL